MDNYLVVVMTQPVVSWDDLIAGRKRKRELVQAAEKYIKQSRKDNA